MTESWKVFHGDCRDVLPTLEGVDHVITDPQYEAEAHTKARRCRAVVEGRGVGDYAIPFDAMDPETRTIAGAQFARLARRWCLVFCQVEASQLWRADIRPHKYIRTCVWVKPDATPQLTGDRPSQGYESIVVTHGEKTKLRWNGGGTRGVFTHFVNPPNRTHEHPTEKPISLMLELVALFTDPGDLILDPFCGSGSTGIAALRLGRRFIGVEKDKAYAELAISRLQAEANQSTLHAQRAQQEALFR